jgi:hypothetical protein
MMHRALLPLFLLATPAFAGSFTPPEGCTATLTLQGRGCYVANYYTCEGENPGDKWRADFDQEGMFYLSKIDNETQWVESYSLNPKVMQTLDPNPKDPANFTSLLETGRDDFEFGLTKETGEHTNVKGYDKLTGETVTIDGMTLLQTEFDYVESDDEGNELRKAHGNEFVSEEFRNFFSGTSEYWDGADWLPMDGTPVQFARPGDKGFAVTQPLFDCDAVMSQLAPPISDGKS